MRPAVAADKRWRDREQRWARPADGRPLFDPRAYAVDGADERDAKPFVVRHHYAASYPAARLAVGLWGPGAALAGVAVFSVPITERVVPAHTGGRCSPREGVELGRFVLLDHVAYNAETWFLARALRLLRAELPEVRAVVSYADPLGRHAADGALVKRAHWGTIYRAANARPSRPSSPRTLLVAPDGSVVSGRALTKVRKQEKGHAYAERKLVAAGAPARDVGESPPAWLRRVSASPGFRSVRHPGNLAYVFGLTRGALPPAEPNAERAA